MANVAKVFLTFADSRISLDRIKMEAKRFKFDKLYAFCETDLDNDFWKKHKIFICTHSRGFGYWIWKAQVVLQVLKKMKDGDFLVYADAGCSLNVEGIVRMNEYYALIQEKKMDGLAFSLGLQESTWCKRDLLEYLNYTQPVEMESGQLIATTFILRNSESVRELVKKWGYICSHYHYITDAPSVTPNRSNFDEHRHDQSIWSILRKQNGRHIILDNETWFHPDWHQHLDKPIHARHWLQKLNRPAARPMPENKLDIEMRNATYIDLISSYINRVWSFNIIQ